MSDTPRLSPAARIHAEANACLDRGLWTEALALYQRAAQIAPDLAEPHYGLGRLAEAQSRPEQAEGHYRDALSRNPGLGPALNNLANLLSYRGDLAGAHALLEQAIEANPLDGGVWKNLADLHRFADGDPLAVKLDSLAGRLNEAPEVARVGLHFALAKSLEDRGQFDQAFAHMAAGNQALEAVNPTAGADAGAFLKMIPDLFPAPLMARHAGPQGETARPVFIVGLPRSGTTLVEQILGAHPAVTTGGESDLLQRHLGEVKNGQFNLAAPATISEAACQTMAAMYLDALAKRHPEGQLVTDKTPANFQFIGYLAMLLPNARIIHLRRDARDVCLSCFATLFSRGQAWTRDFDRLAAYHADYRRVMAHWDQVLPGRVLHLDYEALVADPQAAARRLLEHLGLAWDDACAAPHQSPGRVTTASRAQVRQPIYSRSVGRWKAFEPHLGPLIEKLGL